MHTLRQATTDDMQLCCILAVQLCVYGYYDAVWNASLIPRELSTKILHHLRRCKPQSFADNDLLLWLVYVGKAFAIDAQIRDGLDEVWFRRQCDAGTSVFPPWDEAKRILSKFIWSDVLHSDARGWFWQRIHE